MSIEIRHIRANGFTFRCRVAGSEASRLGRGGGVDGVRDHAERVASWVALSVPHLASYGAAFELPEHRDKVAYIADTLVPGRVEEALSRNGFEQLYRSWESSGGQSRSCRGSRCDRSRA